MLWVFSCNKGIIKELLVKMFASIKMDIEKKLQYMHYNSVY